MELIHTIGFVSAALTTSAFLPQAVKTWRTRSTSDLSPHMFFLFCIGILGWLVYGVLIRDLPIILANAVTICLAGSILYFIINGRSNTEIAHIGIFVEDLENIKSFYCNTFNARAGLKYSNPDKKFTSYVIQFQTGARLEIMHQEMAERNKTKSRWGHLAISTGSRSNVDQLTKTLQNQGVVIHSNPRYTGDGYYESSVVDPEGNLIEITV
jgi:lactoylglutathione lyase